MFDFFGGKKRAALEQTIRQQQDQLSKTQEQLDRSRGVIQSLTELAYEESCEQQRKNDQRIDSLNEKMMSINDARIEESQRRGTLRDQVLNLFAKGALPEFMVLDVEAAWEMDSRFDVHILVGGVLKQFSLVSYYTTDCANYHSLQERYRYRQEAQGTKAATTVLNEIADARSLEEIVLKSVGCLPGDFYRIMEVNPDVLAHDLMRFEFLSSQYRNPDFEFPSGDQYRNPEQVTEEHEQSA